MPTAFFVRTLRVSISPSLLSATIRTISRSPRAEARLLLRQSEQQQPPCSLFSSSSSLQDVLRLGSHLSPETIRRFWRASALSPADCLDIIVGFSGGPQQAVCAKKVDFLWKLFGWVARQQTGGAAFCHLPASYRLMISMLVRARRPADAESLLLSAEEAQHEEAYSEIIEGYVQAGELGSSVSLYDRARDRGLILSPSLLPPLIDLSIETGNAELALRAFADMVRCGTTSSGGLESRYLDSVAGAMAESGRIVEALNLLRKVRNFGIRPSPSLLTALSMVYCRKGDFEDMLKFMIEWGHVPESHVCNAIVSSLCVKLGADEAWPFVQRIESLGLVPDATTFAILICHSCKEGKLRNAFVYLSESSCRSVTPQVHAYNALISALFKQGLHKHAKHIFNEMIEIQVSPNASTFNVLLAGYCKYRKFDEVKMVLNEMRDRGVISLSPLEDALSKAFVLLGLDRLGVRVKRDNDPGLQKAEFFDSLGNGIYLETDLEEYEMMLAGILDNAALPDFDPLLVKECGQGNAENALRIKVEAVQWGQNLSLSSYSELVKCLCATKSYVKEATDILQDMPELCNLLNHETLNLLISSLRNNKINIRQILNGLLKKEMMVESNACSALIKGLCKERDISGLRELLRIAHNKISLQKSKDIKALVSCLCKLGMIHEVLELLASMIERDPNSITYIVNAVLKELCLTGYTGLGCSLVEEFLYKNLITSDEVYLHLIAGFLKEEKFAEALGIVYIVLEKNIDRCPNIFQLFLSPLIRFNQIEKAISLKRFFLSSQCEADVIVYSTLITKLCKIGKVKEATMQLQEMLANGMFLDNDTLNTLMQGYCQEDNWERASVIFGLMLKVHVHLSLSSYRSMVSLLCRDGQVRKALSLKEMMEGQCESRSLILYNILIFYLFHTGHNLSAEALLNKMQEKQVIPDQVTYNFLIYGSFKCRNISNAVEIINNIIAKGLRPSNRSLRIVICYLCSHGKLDEALELSKVMERSGWSFGSTIQNVLVGGLLSHGRFHEAEIILDRIEEKSLIPRYINYDVLIKQFCIHGRITKAVDLLNIMIKAGDIPNENSYSAVIHRLCASKKFDQALNFHAEMQQKNLKPSLEASDVLIHGLCVNGRTDEARKILRAMVQFGLLPTYSMYRYVLDGYHAKNNLEMTSELVQEMQKNGYSPGFQTHWSLISNLSSLDSKDHHDGNGFLSNLLSGSLLRSKDSNVKDEQLWIGASCR